MRACVHLSVHVCVGVCVCVCVCVDLCVMCVYGVLERSVSRMIW